MAISNNRMGPNIFYPISDSEKPASGGLFHILI